MPSVSESVEKLEISSIIDENTKWYSLFLKCFISFYKCKHKYTSQPSNSTPRYLPRTDESICWHRYLNTNAHESIHNGQQLETTRMSMNSRMDKHIGCRSIVEHWIPVSIKSHASPVRSDKDGSQNRYARWKWPRTVVPIRFHLCNISK